MLLHRIHKCFMNVSLNFSSWVKVLWGQEPATWPECLTGDITTNQQIQQTLLSTSPWAKVLDKCLLIHFSTQMHQILAHLCPIWTLIDPSLPELNKRLGYARAQESICLLDFSSGCHTFQNEETSRVCSRRADSPAALTQLLNHGVWDETWNGHFNKWSR